MKSIGTKEIKDLIINNDKVMINDDICICKVCNIYSIYEKDELVMKTSKVNLVLDWLSDNDYLYETRFRLTAYQKNILRENMWTYIGCIILGALVVSASIAFMWASLTLMCVI